VKLLAWGLFGVIGGANVWLIGSVIAGNG
jgi:hypothetical protein